MVVIELETAEQFPQHVTAAGSSKVVFVDFYATWCGPCRMIAPEFERLSNEYAAKAIFLRADTDKLDDFAQMHSISAMPTFLTFKDGRKVDTCRGANPANLLAMIKKWTDNLPDVDAGDNTTDGGVKLPQGMVDLNSFINKSGSECLNESDDHTLEHALTPEGGYLESDCDEQLIITFAFTQNIKLHSLLFRANGPKAPKHVRIFLNLPNSPDFDSAEGMEAVQEFDLTPEELNGETLVPLKFVKFQNVNKVTFFIKNNQGEEETTQIDYIGLIGRTVDTTNMGDFKRIAGKKGESH